MKNIVYIGWILISIGLIGLMIEYNIEIQDLKYELVCERALTDQQIKQLEKQIRVLKTDIDIVQYGFIEDQNAKQN